MTDSVEGLLAKARQSVLSASALLDIEDPMGATNRAYYAMFYAARAALVAVGSPAVDSKTHSSVIAAFGLHLIQTNLLPPELGRSLNRVERLRLIGDYRDEGLDQAEVQAAVDRARAFVHAIEKTFDQV